jgi:hypothetical protein
MVIWYPKKSDALDVWTCSYGTQDRRWIVGGREVEGERVEGKTNMVIK